MKAMMILAAVLLLVVAATNTQYLGRTEEVKDAIAPVDIPSSLVQSDEAGPELKLVLLALRPEGFETNEMQLEPGEHLFIIGNRTGLSEVAMRLDRQGNGRVAEATVGGRQRDLKKRLRLTQGIYILSANDNPDWTCRIVVGH